MAGQRAKEGATLVTPRAAYRSITAAGETATDSAIPILDTRGGPNQSVGLSNGDVNQYGQNAVLMLSVLLCEFSSITLQVWLKAELEAKTLSNGEETSSSSSSSSSSSCSLTTGEWVLVEERTFTASSLWVVRNIPPGQYKVIMTAATGSGEVTVREQHGA